jgi:hypothetical protein
MKRASYRAAVYWLAANDDCHWICQPVGGLLYPSLPAALVIHVWGIDERKFIKDLKRELRFVNPFHPALKAANVPK